MYLLPVKNHAKLQKVFVFFFYFILKRLSLWQNLQKNNMKTSTIIAFSLFAMTFASCGNKTKEAQPVEEQIVEIVDSVTGIIRLKDYSSTDSVTVNDKTYKYTFAFMPVDSLPIITNSQGAQYYDNEVKLTVTSEGTTVYSHTFRKGDFNGIAPSDLMKTSSLVGFNYNYLKHDDHSALYFIATIGDPDISSEISYPIEIKVTAGGTMTMEKAQGFETEPLHSDMNEDPNDDYGV